MTEPNWAKERILQQYAVLHNINRIFRAALNCDTEEELVRRCLAIAEDMTESKFGFLGEVDGNGRLHDLAISDPGWEACRMQKPTGHRSPPRGFAIHGIYGRVLLDSKSLYTNDPSSHPDHIGTPPGHPPLSTFLGVPLVHDERTIGMVAVGNREGGYRDEDQQALEALAPAIVQTLMRGRAVRALREARNQVASLARFPEENPDPVFRVSADGNLLYANASAHSVFGELLFDHDQNLSMVFGEAIRQTLDLGRQTRHEITYGERTYLMTLNPSKLGINVYGQDISERKRTEVQFAVLTRLHSVLSRVNEAIIRTRDERSLYQQACEIIAEQGEYALVWIGLVRDREISPVARSGPESDYIQTIRVELDGELGRGPTGTCVREDRAVVNDNFECNPLVGPWRGAALGHGFRSSAAFPLHRQGQVIGALTLYATRVGAFDSDHTQLLGALCADISYALDALEQERLRTNAERALKQSEQSLRDADRRKNQFLAVLSHELRNPLAPLQNGTYILEHAEPGSEPAIRATAIISRQVRQLARLVDDLLDVTRITRGKLRLQRIHFDIAQMICRVVEDHKARFVDDGVTLESRIGFRPLWIDGDEQRLAQVVNNLLVNAAKFSSRGGKVTLELDADVAERLAIIRVRDTGVGISAEMLPRLFDAFIQADETIEHSDGGLGLGLAIVKGVVDMHGGRVEACSAGLGMGAEFIVQLPASLQEFAQQVRTPSNRSPPRRVLVIEDNQDAADSLREALEFNDHKVEVAYDGPEGLKKAREFKPEVVLCDLGLPGMSGYDVARALRNDDVMNSTYLVAITGYALPEDQQRAKEAGFDRHLPKPPSMEDIEEMLVTVDSLTDTVHHS